MHGSLLASILVLGLSASSKADDIDLANAVIVRCDTVPELTAQYRLRITYSGRYRATMQLTADGNYEIHGRLPQPPAGERVEFDIPGKATADGTLDLEWRRIEGRGCQVSELWLLRASK